MSRISTTQLYASQLQLLQMQRKKLDQLQTQLAEQKKFSRDSEDLSAAIQAKALSYYNGMLDSYASTQVTATRQLKVQSLALSSAQTTLSDVKKLALSIGAGSDPAERSAMADQLSSFRVSLLATANTSDEDNNYIFAGGNALEQPYVDTGSGYDFQGDAYNRSVAIGPNQTTVTYQSGDGIFGDTSNNVFDQLQVMIDKLSSPTFTPADLADFQAAAAEVYAVEDNVKQASVMNASALVAVKSEADLTTQLKNDNTTAIGDLTSIDVNQVAVELNLQLVAYQASLSTFATIQQNGLFKTLFG